MKQPDKTSFQTYVELEPSATSGFDKLRVDVSHSSRRKDYYLAVIPAETLTGAREGMESLIITQGVYLSLEPGPRFNAQKLATVAELIEQQILARSGQVWEFIVNFTLKANVTIKGWTPEDVEDIKAQIVGFECSRDAEGVATGCTPMIADDDDHSDDDENGEDNTGWSQQGLRSETAPENTRADFLRAVRDLEPFMCSSQRACVLELARGEEKQFFFDKMVQLANIVAGMPATYEQDGRGDDAIVYLHYFKGSGDWHITEKDKGSDDEIRGIQHQAFGLANLGYGAEWTYISIQELVENQVELDFHFTPRTIAEVKGLDVAVSEPPPASARHGADADVLRA